MKQPVTQNSSFWHKNKEDVLLYSAIFLFVGTVTTLMLYALKNKGEKNRLAQNEGTPATDDFCKHGDNFPLRYGSCGNKVAAFQKILKAKGADLGKGGKNRDGIDGKYGSKTQAASQKYFQVASISSTIGQTLNLA